MILFLALNDMPLKADPVDATLTMLSVAAGATDIEALTVWITRTAT